MKLIGRNTRSSRSGVSLVVVGLSVSVLATLSLSMIVATRATSSEKMAQREETAALFAAEAGLSEAVFALNSGGNANVGSKQAPQQLTKSSTYWVTEAALPNGMKTLVSTGIDNRTGMRIELTVEQQTSNLWTWGAFGDETLTMDSNSRVDSYDSSLGTYASQQTNGSGSSAWAMDNGHVGSNGNVDIRQSSSVHGDATPGPSSTASVGSNAYVSGSTTPNTGVVSLPTLQTPTFGSSGNLMVSSATTLPAGDYEFDNLDVDGGQVLTVIGPARVVVDNLELLSNSQIDVDASNGPVEFFVRQDFVLNSNTAIASGSQLPNEVMINLESDNIINPNQNVQLAEVTLQSNSAIHGTIFAPNARIDIDSNFELFGSVIARQVHLDSWARVHFDEALLNVATSNSNADWQAVCWRKLAYQP